MSSLSDFSPDFTADVRARGLDYHKRGLVRLTKSSDGLIQARVEGTYDYRTRLERDKYGDWTYDCTCPYFSDHGEPCKHLWATLLKADQEGVLPDPDADPDGAAREEPDTDAADEGRDEDEGDDEGDDAGGSADRGGRPTGGARDVRPQAQPTSPPRRGGWMPAQAAGTAAWKRQLLLLRQSMETHGPGPAVGPGAAAAFAWPATRRVAYVIDVPATLEAAALTVQLSQQTLGKGGGWERPKPLKIAREHVALLPDPGDRQIIQMLLGAKSNTFEYYYAYEQSEIPRKFVLPESAYATTLRPMCETGRCLLRRTEEKESFDPTPLAWDAAEPWEFWLEVKRSPGGRNYLFDGSLRRKEGDAEQRLGINEPDVVLRGGLAIAAGRVSGLNDFGAFDLMASLRDGLKLTVPGDQADELLRTLFSLPQLPRLDLPEEMRVEEARPAPKPRIKVKSAPSGSRSGWGGGDDRLVAEVSFDYNGQVVRGAGGGRDERGTVFQPDARRVLHRDLRAEEAYRTRLLELGFRQGHNYATDRNSLRLSSAKLPRVVRDLTAEGWHVEAEGKLYRQPGELQVRVSSGIDWFELHGEVSFGDTTAPLPRLLAALRRGEKSVKLDDGTFGLLPEEWLKKYGLLANLGEAVDDHLRFTKRQLGFLDVLLASMPEARVDEVFQHARQELAGFQGVEPADAPAGFVGELRAYQREGLGWMQFLRQFGFGGCLADDMGLGKTVMVLSMLESRRQLRVNGADATTADQKPAKQNGNGDGSVHPTTPPPHNPTTSARPGPSLVVVPKSLVFNWKQEAAKFTPQMRVLDHTGIARTKETAEHFDQFDLILTTYGTLRRDAELFKDVRFDYVVLDEAQAIKNASSGSAKAARLLRADHRLALSGTPVQNHLGELWSLFEFLNPGMLGAASVFKMTSTSAGVSLDPESREVLSRALRPFILRRTKQQVASDLPEKLEQTLFCELEPAQRKQYDELRAHYRQALLERIARDGMNKAKIEILEALLRLRQAACHPGLIDKNRAEEPSAKLDALLQQVLPVLDEGHKVLVFSQFVSLLSIVRGRLDAEKVPYEYLDGQTRDRQARVERFQTDPECKLFLISLKAGGLGLNLTAAEYVFLLDPWWNPAVEAQAIDRAHRIGQTRRVFAYRLIARDTVEEKVLALQQTKRDLADAIISADNSVIAKLGREDLELLLS